MKNLLNILGIILLSVIIISCGNNENNTNSDKQQEIKPINGNDKKGLRPSNAPSTMESKAISYNFDEETKTVTEITINDISCREESYDCIELLKLFNKQTIVFKCSEKSVDNRSNEFDRKVSGELHFADSQMKATLLFHLKVRDKKSSLMGSIILPSDNFKKSSSDVIIYIKGKQE